MPKAAASDTAPRTPVNEMKNGPCHGGEGSVLRTLGISQRGR